MADLLVADLSGLSPGQDLYWMELVDGLLPAPGLEVIKLEFILRLKIKRNDWLFADTCPQAANHCALF